MDAVNLVIIFSVDEPSSIESRETAIPSNHDVALSLAITCHCLMDCEVRDTIVQLLEQNWFMKNYGPKRIISELFRRNISEILRFPIIVRASLISTMRYIISCGCPSMLEMRHLTRRLFFSMM